MSMASPIHPAIAGACASGLAAEPGLSSKRSWEPASDCRTTGSVDGTSGYDFMDEVNALLHDPSGEAPLRELWSSVSGRPADFAVEEKAARREVLDRSFTSQLDAAAASLHRIARMRLETRDVTFAAIRRVLTALLAHFPVYRSYGCARRSAADDAAFAKAVAGAMADCRAADRPIVGLLDSWLGGEAPGALDREHAARRSSASSNSVRRSPRRRSRTPRSIVTASCCRATTWAPTSHGSP